jgi:hypothetical protein
LSKADLSSGTNLSHADLGRADLTEANLCGADLRGANLRDAILTDVIYDKSTHFPMGFNPEPAGAINVEQTLRRETPQSSESPPQAPVDASSVASTLINPPIPTPPNPPPVSTSSPTTVQSPSPPVVQSQPSQNQDWQKAALISGGVGALVASIVGLLIFRSLLPPASQSPVSSLNTQQDFNSPDVTEPLGVSRAPQSTQPLSQSEAANLIGRWLQAKRSILAPPYNRQLSDDLTTDVLLNDLNKPNGSISWLQNNNAYYRFGVQRVDGVEQFSTSDVDATIFVKVTEERTLTVNGRIDSKETNFSTRRIRYNLKLVDGRWKIADFKVMN